MACLAALTPEDASATFCSRCVASTEGRAPEAEEQRWITTLSPAWWGAGAGYGAVWIPDTGSRSRSMPPPRFVPVARLTRILRSLLLLTCLLAVIEICARMGAFVSGAEYDVTAVTADVVAIVATRVAPLRWLLMFPTAVVLAVWLGRVAGNRWVSTHEGARTGVDRVLLVSWAGTWIGFWGLTIAAALVRFRTRSQLNLIGEAPPRPAWLYSLDAAAAFCLVLSGFALIVLCNHVAARQEAGMAARAGLSPLPVEVE